jgi:hypothetical protein
VKEKGILQRYFTCTLCVGLPSTKENRVLLQTSNSKPLRKSVLNLQISSVLMLSVSGFRADANSNMFRETS